MDQSVLDRLEAAFLNFEASQREAESAEERQREEVEVKRREFESIAADKVMPVLRKIEEKIQIQGWWANTPSVPPYSDSGCVLEFIPMPPPPPTWKMPYSFMIRRGAGGVINVIHSNPKSESPESGPKNVPLGEITTEWVVREAAKFVEMVLREHR
jgi:hypothetical protein